MSSSPNSDISAESARLLEAAIEERLRMTYEERIDAHQNALELLNELKSAGETLRAKSQSPS